MKCKHILLIAICGVFSAFYSGYSQTMPSRQFFIENKGQWPEEVKFLTRVGGMDAWVTEKGITYDFYTFKNTGKSSFLNDNFLKETGRERRGHVVAMRFKNALDGIVAESREQQPGIYNYLIGQQSNWTTGVRLFKEVSLLKVYEGIDARIYLDEGSLRYDMILKASADPAQIAMTFDGADKVSINKKGELVLKTSLGDVVQQKLFAFQTIDGKKKKVECRFALKNGDVGFEVGKYDRTKPLVIDPLICSTYIGGINFDNVRSVAVDTAGAAYITGATNSPDYPTTPGSQRELEAYSLDDIFVTKLSTDGRYLDYSTFIGGKGRDMAFAIAVEKDLCAYVTGYTYSWESGFNIEFPTTTGAFDRTHNSPGPSSTKSDGFVLKLNRVGSDLQYSTFFGGNEDDYARAITLDRNGNAYIAGETHSTNLPVSTNAFDKVLGSDGEPEFDVFITKVNPSGSGIIYCTYFGNTGLNTQATPLRDPNFVDDYVAGIAIDSTGNIFLVGTTTSDHFPTTPGAFDSDIGLGLRRDVFRFGEDIYVAKFNVNVSGLLYCTYIGGDSTENAGGIVVDRQGNAWITGQTFSVTTAIPQARFPVTPGAFDTVLATAIPDDRPSSDAILCRLNAEGTALLYSTLIGNGNQEFERGEAIAIDSAGSIYITGQTNSAEFPTINGLVHDRNYNGEIDAFCMKFPATGGNAPDYSSFLGGSANDFGRSIAVDLSHDVYIAGGTLSINFPHRAYGGKSFDTTFNSIPADTEDGFIAKFRMGCNLVVDAGRDTVLCPGDSVLIGNRVNAGTGLAPFTYVWTPNIDITANAFEAVVRPSVTRK